ncbi:MAG: DUF370 domain-containing protein [Lachnospiraceae bacterium]|nr:DUF370 domain-containing protein [Lachnospiraceae bacterium]
MSRLVNIGYGNVVNSEKILAVIRPEAAPVKRMVQAAKDHDTYVDATCGRKCKSVIVAENGRIILSALLPETIAGRVNAKLSSLREEFPESEE